MLLLGDCLLRLKELPENSVDAVVTDPPYGISFMGKKWDYDVPSVDVWSAVLRVLKPGGHLLSFGGTRTFHRMVVAIEDAGFEIRDQLQWIYGSGFPKSHNIKDGEFKGWGTALKPANEPIVLARKPLDGTVAQNIQKWGTGGLNIDGCRLGHGDDRAAGGTSGTSNTFSQCNLKGMERPTGGRWPANVLFDEEAAKALDEQSGERTSGKPGIKRKGNDGAAYGAESRAPGTQMSGFGDSGGASRFFYVAKASKRERNAGLEGMPEQTTSDGRAIAADNAYQRGKTTRQNHHPTVKPIKLMEYLVKLITPPTGIVLDPFTGSGSTGVAAHNLGFGFIGIEMNEEYLEIAKRRIEHAKETA